uniref:Uncharacterized protein n=1 Tax=Anguilla anguilla TaxID=7936 RepID=A0A0E9S907_ANGAN
MNLLQAQEWQIQQYNWGVQQQTFKQGDKVLVLLPSSASEMT